jgi:twinkle protein
VRAFWDAKVWRPDGIREGREFTKERLKQKRRAGYELPYPQLNEKLMGLRKGEITMLTAGSGIGKSTLRSPHRLPPAHEHGLKIGNIYLEEDNDTTVDAYVACMSVCPSRTSSRPHVHP